MDIVGCPECPNGMKADVRDLSMLGDKQFGAAFVGHVFECVPGDLEPRDKAAGRVVVGSMNVSGGSNSSGR